MVYIYLTFGPETPVIKETNLVFCCCLFVIVKKKLKNKRITIGSNALVVECARVGVWYKRPRAQAMCSHLIMIWESQPSPKQKYYKLSRLHCSSSSFMLHVEYFKQYFEEKFEIT